MGCLVLCGYSTPLAGYLRYRLFFDTPRPDAWETRTHSSVCVLCFYVQCVCVCVELIVSSLYCLHSVYAILILSIPICKNVLSFVSFSLLLSLESELERGSREVMAYTIECCWGKPLSKYVYTCSIYIYNIVCTCFRESVLRLLAVSRNSSKELKE